MIVNLWSVETGQGRRWRYRVGLGPAVQLETDGGLHLAMDMASALAQGAADAPSLAWHRLPNGTYAAETPGDPT
jgi:hypothetical protein